MVYCVLYTIHTYIYIYTIFNTSHVKYQHLRTLRKAIWAKVLVFRLRIRLLANHFFTCSTEMFPPRDAITSEAAYDGYGCSRLAWYHDVIILTAMSGSCACVLAPRFERLTIVLRGHGSTKSDGGGGGALTQRSEVDITLSDRQEAISTSSRDKMDMWALS